MRLLLLIISILVLSFFPFDSRAADQPSAYNKSKPDIKKTTVRVVERAKELIGTPYKQGGTSEAKGFDCSGLLVYLFRNEAGMTLPRTTSSMIKERYQRVSRSELQPGDAVFFSHSTKRKVDHVGLYIGNNRFIHAPRAGKNVRIDSMNSRFWKERFFSARRFNSKFSS